MKRRYHPPLPPSEVQHIADSYEPTGMTSEEIDAVFRCHHGVDLCDDGPCDDCRAETAERMDRGSVDEYFSRVDRDYERFKEEE